MGDDHHSLIAFRVATVRVGIQATAFAVIALAVYAWMDPAAIESMTAYWVEIAVAVAGAALITSLPWDRLFRTPWGIRIQYAWSLLDIVLISLLVHATGGASSELYVLYGLTTAFFAMSYPSRGQIVLLVVTALAYGAVVATGVTAATLFFRIAIMTALAGMVSFIARRLMRETVARAQAHDEAERRSRLLEGVTTAARAMSRLDPEGILSSVADATGTFGFEYSSIVVFDDDRGTYRIAAARGLPREYAEAEHDGSEGLAKQVRAAGATLSFDEYGSLDGAVPLLRGAPIGSGVGTPIWSRGRVAGVLFVAFDTRRKVSREEIEAVELLAAQAGRALDNAAIFERERDAAERLRALDTLKDEFISTASHELRTPLTAIEGMGSTLERHWASLDEPTRLHLLSRLNANARTLHGIVDTLLDSARIQADRQLGSVPVDVGSTVTALCNRLEYLFSDHRIVVDLPDDLYVEADPLLLDRVLENLLGNAVKHTPAGTTITIGAQRSGERARITISDDGQGIPEAVLARLGERFFRGETAAAGTGLGLAFVKRVLEMHGTSLTVESDHGRGTRFSFALPVALQARFGTPLRARVRA